MATYFAGSTGSERGRGTDASSNTTVSVSTNYDIEAVTGVGNQITIDICAATAQIPQTTGASIRLRVDTHSNDGTFLNSYVTPNLYLDDISAVAGNLSATPGNIGKKLAKAPNLPFYFRTICGDGINAATTNKSIRVTVKDAEKIQNGMKVNVYAHKNAANSNVNINNVDVSMDDVSASSGQLLVNGGALGADAAIPAFTATMTKNATTATSGDVKVFTNSPMFKGAGDGIDLSSVTFRFKNLNDGTESFETIAMPTAEKEGKHLPNSDQLYEYDVSTLLSVAGQSYQIMGTAVTDTYNVYGYAMQNNTNGLINLNNKPNAITQSSIVVDADASGNGADWKTGTRAKVSFTKATTSEGASTLKKYEARWATAAQAKTLGDLINFDTLATAYPNQVNTQTDICSTTNALFPHVDLTGLPCSTVNADGTSDNDTRIGVFVRAYTEDDAGNFVAGAVGNDVSANGWLGTAAAMTNTTGGANVSLGFFVSGIADAPTPVAVKTGKDVLLTTTQTNTDTRKDASMNNNLILAWNDYNVNQRGSNYDSLRYAIVRASDAQYGDSLSDVSFSTAAGTNAWNGNDSAAESVVITGIAAVTHEYDTVNSVWKQRSATTDDVSNGESFAIAYAFDNSNGMGYRSPWTNFVASAHADASLSLFSLDASTNVQRDATAGNGSGWGHAIASADSYAGLIRNNTTFVGKSDAQKAKELSFSGANKSIAFGFSLLDASGHEAKAAGQTYKSPATLDGGSAVTGIRYFVYKSALAGVGESSTETDARVYGAGYKDISADATVPMLATFGQSVAATKDTNRLVVSKGYDASGALQNLKNGQRYDICFGLINANGFNDLSMSILQGFAPLGSIDGVKNLRAGSTACEMKDAAGNASTTSATFSISFEDLSGVAEHGGHLVNQYNYTVTQYQGPVLGTKTVVDNAVLSSATAANVFAKANATAERELVITTASSPVTRPGYPLTVSIHPVAVAATGQSDICGQNYLYQDGKDVCGATLSVQVPGPTLLAASADDEVRSLTVKPGNGKLSLSFYKPQNDSMKNLYQGAPAVNAYYIYQYDMSLSTITGVADNTLNERAMSRSVTIVSGAADIAADFVEKDITGINGKAYIVAVHTQWRYGVNNDTLQVSQGVYSSSLASSTGVSDVSLSSGLYTLPKVARSNASNRLDLTDCAIPHDAPSIDATNSYLRFDDNGNELTVGAMVQVAPQPGLPSGQGANTTAFYLDLCANSGVVTGDTTITQQKSGGHAINRRTYDICATSILGANWANEKNFVVIQNAAGSAYVKRNIA